MQKLNVELGSVLAPYALSAMEEAIKELDDMPASTDKWTAIVRAIRKLEAMKQDCGRSLGL